MTTDNRTNEPTAERVAHDAVLAKYGTVDNWVIHEAVAALRAHGFLAEGGPCQPAPVPPSSGVDEDKLAEVIGSLDWGYVVDGPSVGEIARAVAEWLNEGENNE